MRNTVICIIALVFICLIMGCKNKPQAPKLEFVSIRDAAPNDTILFFEMVFPFYILHFISDIDLEKYEPEVPRLYLYASGKRQSFDYADLIPEGGDIEKGIISTGAIRQIGQKNGRYYYDAAFDFDSSEWNLGDINDSIYCKVFFIKLFSAVKYSNEMCIPKDSLNKLFNSL